MDELERAGDFKFADSEHIIGIQVPDAEMTDEGFLNAGSADTNLPLAFFATWRHTEAYYRADPEARTACDRAVRQVFNTARAQGVRMLGRYDCRWSTSWDFFTFWLVPNIETLEAIMDQLEQAGDFWFADSRHIIGHLEPQFRFSRHLQPVDGRLG